MDITDIYDATEPPKIRTIKYYLIVLFLFLLVFVFFIGYSFYMFDKTRLVTFTLPADAEFYCGEKLLTGMNQPGSTISIYACRLKFGEHTFRVIDSKKDAYPLELEITEDSEKSKSYIFQNGTFKSY